MSKMRWWERKLSIFGLQVSDEGKECEIGSGHRRLAIGIWTVLFLMFLSWTLWLFLVQAANPYIMNQSGWEEGILSTSSVPTIVGTHIFGLKAVKRFRKHLDCFSESGKWEYNITPRKIPWNFVGDPFANQCDGRHVLTPGNVAGLQADEAAFRGSSNWTVREELKWAWRSNISCPILPFDRENFCSLIGSRRNILLVGDSINHELQWVMLNNLLANVSEITPSLSSVRTWEGFEMCEDVLGEGHGFKIGFVRNDRLSPTLEIKDDGWSNILEWPWLPFLETWGTRILILNRGAHFEADDIYTSELKEILSILRKQHPDILVIFRNTPPGHKNCNTFYEPLHERQHDLPAEWHWGEFYRQNGLAKTIVERNEYIYMDVDVALSLRPDGHISGEDCLHYCLPGPLDYVVELLYNIFVTIYEN